MKGNASNSSHNKFLPSGVATLCVHGSIVTPRNPLLMTLCVEQGWRATHDISTEKIYSSALRAACLSSISLEEVKCQNYHCKGKIAGSIRVVARQRVPQTKGTFEQYEFDLFNICTSSRIHMQVPSLCIAVKLLPDATVKSMPIQLHSKFLRSTQIQNSSQSLTTTQSTSPPSSALCRTVPIDTHYFAFGLTINVRLVLLSPDFTDQMCYTMLAHGAKAYPIPGRINFSIVGVPHPQSSFQPSCNTGYRLKLLLSSFNNVSAAQKAIDMYFKYIRNACEYPNIFNTDIEANLMSQSLAFFGTWD
ncbi:hypothetical protein Pelo_8957 [Pelomyxa schiedti]|nr:hypothetical protein Pelo_8957 [Pelomyxa schiedti]